MKAFVTGGTGFIGSRVVSMLIDRGYEVYALVRSERDAEALQALGVKTVRGDITAKESMYDGMKGSDVVFHIAGWYKLGKPNWEKAYAINVDGTRNVLELAHELDVPKIIYTSTIAVYGDTHGYLVDETYVGPEGSFLTEYDHTKWLAHYKVALPLIERGAPIIIVMPGVVYGPGDTSLIGEMMRLFYKGLFPILPGPEFTLTFAHVDDIAYGHILAAEKGDIGESYLLVGPVFSMGEMVNIWAEISGRRPPIFHVPACYLKPFAIPISILETIMPLPKIVSRDTIVILDATYIARAVKAESQLGWQTRPPAEGMRETFDWIAKTTTPLQIEVSPIRRRQLAGLVLGVSLGVLFAWLISRRRK